MDRLRLTRGFWVSAKRLSPEDRGLLNLTLNRLNDDFPKLPGAGDVQARMEPGRRCFARRVGWTVHWLYFDLSADGVDVFAVAPLVSK